MRIGTFGTAAIYIYAAVGLFKKSIAGFTIILSFYFQGPKPGTKPGPKPTGKPSPIQPKSTPKAISKSVKYRTYVRLSLRVTVAIKQKQLRKAVNFLSTNCAHI